jgi:hypothetical protein
LKLSIIKIFVYKKYLVFMYTSWSDTNPDDNREILIIIIDNYVSWSMDKGVGTYIPRAFWFYSSIFLSYMMRDYQCKKLNCELFSIRGLIT